MPRGRGGKREGTPGKGYSNRTDLAMAPDMSQNTAATGGMTAPAPQAQPMQPPAPVVGADEVPNLTDPTQRPGEPVTHGLAVGAGGGSEVVGPMPPAPADPVRQAMEALMLISPNPDLQRILTRLDFEGR